MEHMNDYPRTEQGHDERQLPPPPEQAPPPPPPPAYGRRDLPFKSTAFAVVLSFLLPGLGQVYVGFYKQAFTIILIFASIVALLASGSASGMEPLLGILLGFLYFYQIVDAGRRASLYNRILETGQAGLAAENIDLPETNPFVGGVILLIVGFIALMNTLFGFSLEWLADWWPVLMIGAGAWLIVKGRREKERQESDGN